MKKISTFPNSNFFLLIPTIRKVTSWLKITFDVMKKLRQNYLDVGGERGTNMELRSGNKTQSLLVLRILRIKADLQEINNVPIYYSSSHH